MEPELINQGLSVGSWVQWVIAIGAGGLISVLNQVFHFIPNKKIKSAEATKIQFEVIKLELDNCKKSIQQLYVDLGIREESERQLMKDISVSEIKRYKLKSCISCAHGCAHSADCPVLKRQREIEDEWTKTKNKDNGKEDNKGVPEQ